MTLSPVERFLIAAQRGDPVALNKIVNWPLSSAARLTTALHDLPPSERAEAARIGLRNLVKPEGNYPATSYPLGSLALRLSANPQVRTADPNERHNALTRLRVGSLPSGLDADTIVALVDLSAQLSAIEDVVIITFGINERVALAIIPGSEQVALVRHL